MKIAGRSIKEKIKQKCPHCGSTLLFTCVNGYDAFGRSTPWFKQVGPRHVCTEMKHAAHDRLQKIVGKVKIRRENI